MCLDKEISQVFARNELMISIRILCSEWIYKMLDSVQFTFLLDISLILHLLESL